MWPRLLQIGEDSQIRVCTLGMTPNRRGGVDGVLGQLVYTALPAHATQLVRSVAWSILGGILAQGCTLLSAIAAARILGRISYGQFAGAQATAIAVSNLGNLGMGIVATKYLSQYRDSDPDRASRILGLVSAVALIAGALTGAGMLVFASKISFESFGTRALAPGLRWSGVYAFFMILNGYQAGALAGLESFRQLARVGAYAGIASFVCTVVLSRAFGEGGALAAFAVSAFFVWALHQSALKKELRRWNIAIKYPGAWQERSALVRFAIPATYSGLVGSLAIWWTYGQLVKDRGFAEVAIYAAVNSFRAAVLFVPNLVVRVTAPLMNHLFAAGRISAYRRVYRFSGVLNVAVALLVASILASCGPWILKAFGRTFHAGAVLLWLMMASAVMEVIARNVFQTTFARSSLWWQVLVISVWSFLLVAVTSRMVHAWGGVGLAAAYIISWASSAFLYFRFSSSLREREEV